MTARESAPGKPWETGQTEYIYAGGQLVSILGTNPDYRIDLIYDESGVQSCIYTADTAAPVTYYLIKNAQGDVMQLRDEADTIVANYAYDAFGRLLSVTDIDGKAISDQTSFAHRNPLRYRGYLYDSETGFYYLSSRYYDPKIRRFINADAYVSTGQGVAGYNMFAYCGNNPVNRSDSHGHFWSEIWEFAKMAVSEIGKAMGLMSPAYAGCGGVAAVDGPLPFGDIIAAAGATLLTIGAIGIGITQAAKAPAKAASKAKAEEKDVTAPSFKKNQVYFPEDPYSFTPKGLIMNEYPGTKNGSIISWIDPLKNTEVFRWDENLNYPNGPHYHIHGTGHYYQGMIVPEPYATIYFPLK